MAYLPVHSALFRSVVCSIQVLHVLLALHLGIACFYVLLKWFFFSFNCSLPMHKHIRFFYTDPISCDLAKLTYSSLFGGRVDSGIFYIDSHVICKKSFIFSLLLSMPRFCMWFILLFHLEHFIFGKIF